MIKKTTFIILIAVMMVTMTFAQGRGRNRAANRAHTFDVAVPVNITGKIVKVESVTNERGRYCGGIHLTVDNGTKQVPVSLGPSAYLDSNKWEFKQGERITVKAFKGTGDDNGALFASQVTRNGEQLTLRDKDGLPMWSRSMNKRGNRMAGRRGCGRRFNK